MSSLILGASTLWAQQVVPPNPLNINPPKIGTDLSVRYDFDIVYVRAPRRGATVRSAWAEVGDPRYMEPGASLVLLHPDGKEEVLVAVSSVESIADPVVSFDGNWVYFAKFHNLGLRKGSDLYKIHIPTRRVVQLTQQVFTPNTGVAAWTAAQLPQWGVFNLGPCPVPGGKLAFVSDRNAFKATNPGYAPHALALQLFIMDDDGSNVECIGHLNLGFALHPVILKDGRIMFSSLESQGLRSPHLWGLWSIYPDGTQWMPLFSAFETASGTTESLHFQAQLSDESVVAESYYNLNNSGFGSYFKLPAKIPAGYPAFGPAYKNDPRNPPLRQGGIFMRYPFSPFGIESLTPFTAKFDGPAPPSILGQSDSPRVGKFTHPAAAPDNHLLTVWSAGSVYNSAQYTPAFDSGIYLIKSGNAIDEPGKMLLIKNDSRYHEQWPRALVPYKRIYGVDAPLRPPALLNDGKKSAQLPEGTPFGMVGTSSLYKRESYPYGAVRPGTVTASFALDKDPTGYRGFDTSYNWTVQGAEAGLYSNGDIHAIRIVLLEPTSTVGGVGQTFANHINERMRILGEIPVRKFTGNVQPLDPDGNPDTSFLAKIPADVAWTFQTLDKNSMVLNSAQTWHQVRPGEIRNNCGGCHAHSQQPTLFEQTAASRADYAIFDLIKSAPLITTKALDQSGKKWDVNDETGLRFARGVQNVEFFRDVKPILDRSCVACHTKTVATPPGHLVLDDNQMVSATYPSGLYSSMNVPGTYARLAADGLGVYSFKPLVDSGWGPLTASRYVYKMQSRRSLLIWKIYGKRLDGWDNEDLPYESVPGTPSSLRQHGQPIADTPANRKLAHIGYVGSVMPPPAAVAGTYVGPGRKTIKVPALTSEEQLTLVRWIDLGCPIDLTFNPAKPPALGGGWTRDDQRPTLTLTYPQAGANASVTRLLVGMYDVESGLDATTFRVVADFPVDGAAAGTNLVGKFVAMPQNVWEYRLATPLAALPKGLLTVSVKDRQGNIVEIKRTFSVTSGPAR
ncbi:MAG: hypothetical protein K8T25_01485 [Planctomycetia bacterium]|nr:hypothetical protein [Planctomycetia bacterium]